MSERDLAKKLVAADKTIETLEDANITLVGENDELRAALLEGFEELSRLRAAFLFGEWGDTEPPNTMILDECKRLLKVR